MRIRIVQKYARWARIIGIIALAILLVGLWSSSISTLPVAAQNAGVQVLGEPITATSSGVVNFSALAQREKLSPSRNAPVVFRRPLPGPDRSNSKTGAPIVTPRIVTKPQLASPAPAASFQALDDANFSIPPDTHGAVGPNHLMVASNTQVRIQDRNGGVISTVNLTAFWSPLGVIDPGSFAFDTKILYDPFANRWMIVSVANESSANSAVLVGVSQSNDPTGSWNLFAFDADAANILWADYTSLGFNKDWIVVSVNMFAISNNAFTRGQIYAFNKSNLYSNNNSGHTVFNSSSVPFTLVPAITYDNTLATEHLVNHYSSINGTIRKSTITGSPPVLNVDTAIVTSSLGAWSIPGGDFLPQSGTTRLIDVGDSRMQNVVVRTVSGTTTIWATQTIALPAGTSSPTHAAVQWWQLNSSPSSSVIIQQGRIEDATATQTNGGKHFAFPTLAVNQFGDMLIGYSRFSANAFASVAYSFRYNTDALNTMRDDTLLKAGMGAYEKTFGGFDNRWGDYSNTVVDPVNDTDLWTIQEYADAPVGTGADSGRWGLWWGKIAVTPPGPTPTSTPTPTRTPTLTPTPTRTPTATSTPLQYWVYRSNLNSGRYWFQSATANGKIYAIGGNGAMSSVEEYNPTTNTWSTRANMPTARGGAAVATGADGKIYVFGGYDTGTLDTVEAYDPVANTWASRTKMLTGAFGAQAALAANGKIYIVGMGSTVQEYNPSNDQWAFRADLPVAAKNLAVTAGTNGKLYAMGGDPDPNTPSYLANVQEYDPVANSWRARANMPTARENLAAVTINSGKIYAIGGFNSAYLSTVEAYDPSSNSWSAWHSLQTARNFLGAAVAANGKIYAVGGFNSQLGFGAGVIVEEGLILYTINLPLIRR